MPALSGTAALLLFSSRRKGIITDLQLFVLFLIDCYFQGIKNKSRLIFNILNFTTYKILGRRMWYEALPSLLLTGIFVCLPYGIIPVAHKLLNNGNVSCKLYGKK